MSETVQLIISLILIPVCGAIVVIAGIKLSKYGDRIAETTGLSHGFVGIILLSFATSLPEFITTVGSVLPPSENPNLALGNVYGSNVFNFFIIFLLGFYIRRNKEINLYKHGKSTNDISVALVIILTIISFMGLILPHLENKNGGEVAGYAFTLGHISIYSIIVFLGWIICVYTIYLYDKKLTHLKQKKKEIKIVIDVDERRKAITGYSVFSLIIIASGYGLSFAADTISEQEVNGVALGGTFVGFLLLATATSLPELVVSGQAIKMRHSDMALGNIVGSNLFNLTLIFLADLFFFKGGIYNYDTAGESFYVDLNHIITGMMGLIMLGIYLLSTHFQPRRRLIFWELPSILMLIVYVFTMYLIFVL